MSPVFLSLFAVFWAVLAVAAGGVIARSVRTLLTRRRTTRALETDPAYHVERRLLLPPRIRKGDVTLDVRPDGLVVLSVSDIAIARRLTMTLHERLGVGDPDAGKQRRHVTRWRHSTKAVPTDSDVLGTRLELRGTDVELAAAVFAEPAVRRALLRLLGAELGVLRVLLHDGRLELLFSAMPLSEGAVRLLHGLTGALAQALADAADVQPIAPPSIADRGVGAKAGLPIAVPLSTRRRE